MARSKSQKHKILELARIFLEETDEDHGVTMREIIQRLHERGIQAERKSIYRDIGCLGEFGFEIRKTDEQPVRYRLVERRFSISELLLVRDAICSCRFLPDGKANDLVDKIKSLASTHQRGRLDGNVYVSKPPDDQCTDVLGNVDIIQSAITGKRRISFKYLVYDLDGQRRFRHDGQAYEQTPVRLIYSSDLYYLIAFDSDADDFRTFRVDRMTEVEAIEAPCVRNERIANFDPAGFQGRAFGMFDGEEVTAWFSVKAEVFDAMIDRFGVEASYGRYDDGTARMKANVKVSPVLFGWLAQFEGLVRIVSPRSLIEDYRSFLNGILDFYGESES